MLVQGKVRARLIILIHIRLEHMAKMPLAEHNNVVKALPSDRADESFSKSVLPWGTCRRRSIAKIHLSKPSHEDLAIGPVPASDQIAGNLFPTICFRELICDPV